VLTRVMEAKDIANYSLWSLPITHTYRYFWDWSPKN